MTLWGAWLPVTARYLSASIFEGGLGFTGSQIGMILGLAGSIGAIAAPFIAGQIADRYFSTERILSFLVISGGMVKWYTATQVDYQSWLLLSILYSVLYMPTLALSNSITFSHISDQENDFPKIRVWGTLGWIAASWAVYSIFLINWKSSFSLMARFTLIAFFGAVSLFPFYLIEESYFFNTAFNNDFIFWVLFAAISPGIIAFSLYTKVQKYVGASLAGFTLYIFSVYSAIYGIILFDETLLSFHYYGAGLVFIGVYLARKIIK